MFQNDPAKKIAGFRAVPKNVTAPYCKDWNLRYPSKMSEGRGPPVSINATQIPPDASQTSKGNSRYQQTADANRHLQTPSDTERFCFRTQP